ncbi:MAG: hypothetical protein HZB41_06830 [Ignavibacteriae bacterium]|nr:hypothetical protein [Ignavibacteriota bacterium]
MTTSEEKGRQSSADGFAHEHITAGILMKKYQNVSLVDLPLASFDIIIILKNEDSSEDIIRAQVKTSKKSVSFTGGSRGGKDRTYKSSVKTYTQSTETSDVVIGIKPLSNDKFELYFVPTVLIGIWKTKSKSLNKIEVLKNNFEMLENCKNYEFVIQKAKEYGII